LGGFVSVLPALAAVGQVTIAPLGTFPGPNAGPSTPTGISDDGSVVSGYATLGTGSPTQSFRRANGGYTQMSYLTGGGPGVLAYAVSGNGQYLTGMTIASNGYFHATRWTSTGFSQDLGSLSNTSSSKGVAISTDGSVVLAAVDQPGFYRGFRWTQATGSVDLGLPTVPSAASALFPTAMSADGSVITGYAIFTGWKVFRWTAVGGFEHLGTLRGLDGDSYSALAYGISGDGNKIVGKSLQFDSAFHEFVWTRATGMQRLGTLGTASSADVISKNGTVICGQYATSGTTPDTAFYYSQGTGMVDLRARLEALGANMSGWVLKKVTAINADGTSMVGLGTLNNVTTSWILTMPLPPAGTVRCSRADVASIGGALTPDGRVTVDDLIAYLGAFFGGNISVADIATVGGGTNPDGQITADDLISFLQAFFIGCP
jgi:probable HAF family extracellular repeat protein